MWIALAAPIAILAAVSAALLLAPGAGLWTGTGGAQYLTYGLLAAGALLGVSFAQSRVTLIAVFLGISLNTLEMCRIYRSAACADAATVLICVLMPAMCATLYRLRERGLFSTAGLRRAAIVAGGVLTVLAAPLFPVLSERVASLVRSGQGLPAPGFHARAVILAALLAASPFLLARKEHESPALGPILLLASLAVGAAPFGALPLRPAVAPLGAFHAFCAAAGAILVWAVLETVWRQANIDDLTQLPARRSLKQHLSRLDPPYAIAMIDIDHFKRINDRHGHDTGDQVLRFIGSFLRRRAPGTLYRYGGEEFCLVCEGQSSEELREPLDQLREAVAQTQFAVRGRNRPRRRPESARRPAAEFRVQRLAITISVGVAEWDERENPQPHAVLVAADAALYDAKRSGRNRVCVWTPPPG
jgi:diguanylate cyclase (GGDEF)-like protein